MSYSSCELPREMADEFRQYLKANKIEYEASGVGSLIHFECLMNSTQVAEANEFIERRC